MVSAEPASPPSLDVDLASCRHILRAGSKSFFAASLLLPKPVRAPATAIYAFCRVADDAVDLSNDPRAALHVIRQRLDCAYAMHPWPNAVDRSFARVVARFGIPKSVPLALLEGFEWDVAHRRYETIDDLEAYCVRVAGTVGLMMALLMGKRSPDVLARACDLGVAMQLTNIARDVGDDARSGRLYLPRVWLAEAGIDPVTFMDDPRHDPALGSVVARLLAVARFYYGRAAIGIELLPRDCRPAIRAASLIYSAIGEDIAARQHDAVTRRAFVSKARKLGLLGRAVMPASTRDSSLAAPAVASAQRLIAACAIVSNQDCFDTARTETWRSAFGNRFVRVLDLFERLERRSMDVRAQSLRQGGTMESA